MRQLNCVGDICPIPVIKLKKALAEADATGLEVVVDNEIAVQNIGKYLNAAGRGFEVIENGKEFVITIAAVFTQSGATSCHNEPDISHSHETPQLSYTVVISSASMGNGDAELGKILLRGFIFALTQTESLPAAVVFYNGGVQHVLSASECLKDLLYLQENGTKILVCGTCLNHYNVLKDLAVGEVTNMYEIVTLLQHAGKIIKP